MEELVKLAFMDTIIMHEKFESAAKSWAPIYSHVSPEVIYRENNIVSTLPKKAKTVKTYFQGLRGVEGKQKPFEMNGVKIELGTQSEAKLFPKRLKYGEQRLSRHAIKRLTENFKNKYNKKSLLEYEVPWAIS